MIFLVAGCSMNKNTWTTRTVQSVNTRFNVHFNGRVSYEEGLKAIAQAQKDDYGLIIPMYPISNHANAAAATSHLNRTIEKSRKAIKTRSIKIKPAYNRRQASKPGYRAFMNQEEYNPFMSEVWMLLAQAEFHKADFLGAVGTFNYIARHFAEKSDLVLACQLWVIRAYAELGWIYEAEDLLGKLNQKSLRGDNVGLYAAVYADLLLKKNQYKEAIPYLEMALNREKDKNLKLRFSFLLAQLYQYSGDSQKAYDAYSKLIKKSPPFEMDFNARISRASLFLGNMSDIRRELNKMTRNFNNKDFLDQLYYTIGKSYLHEKDTVKALDYFQQAVDNSTRNGIDKAVVLIIMGDLYYEKQQYVKSHPCYDEASKIITVDHHDYARISKRAEMLAELVVQYEIVVLQDSLQRLSAMSQEERLQNILAYITKLEQEEKLAAEKEAKLAQLMESNPNLGAPIGGMPAIGGRNPQGEWYFYNLNLIRSGQTEFQSKWGRRKLEDNWRRSNKTAALFAEEEKQELAVNDINSSDTIPEGEAQEGQAVAAAAEQTEQVSDQRNPEFYLRQIPVTKEQLERSSLIWSEALFKMGQIYKDKFEDFKLSLDAFEEYIQRFAGYQYVPDALYQSYLMLVRMGNLAEAEVVRTRLIANYPDSQYGRLLVNPNYVETKQEMLVVQDSIYRLTYKAYNQSDFQTVFDNVEYMTEKYPTNSLMPKFLFLKALSIGKSLDQKSFEVSLNELLEAYPVSEVSAMTKDILALLNQGKEAQQGTTHGSMLARREVVLAGEIGEDAAQLNFNSDKTNVHRLMLISTETEESLYPLQFQLAVYNFSRFLLKDFELNINKIDVSRNAILVFEFENFSEAEWYLQSIAEDEEIVSLMKRLKTFPLIISDYNYALTKSAFTIDDYLIYRASDFEEEPLEENK